MMKNALFHGVLAFGCLLFAFVAVSCAKLTDAVDINDDKDDSIVCLSNDGDSIVRILAIGNSFSMDATEHHLRELAGAVGIDVQVANLYISGGSLHDHWVNAQNDSAAYQYRKMDEEGAIEVVNGFKLSEALIDENWDYVSFQQASGTSGQYDTYVVPLPLLFNYVTTRVADCTTFIFHQTWAYAQDATNPNFANYNNDQMEMYQKIVGAASQAYNLVDFDVFIPVGTAIQNGRTSMAGDNFNRDGYHLDDELGKYTAACTWFEAISNQSVIGNSYRPERLSEYEASIAQHAAHYAIVSPHAITPLEDYAGGLEGPLLYPIYVDFGRNTPTTGWNQIQNSLATSSIFNLTDETDIGTGVSLRILERFNGGNANGATNTNITGFDIPSSVSSDSFFGNADAPWQGVEVPQSVVKVWGLDESLEYRFCFFGSRTGVSDNRETIYEVTGDLQQTATLQTSNNTDQMVCVDHVRPNENGEVLIRISKGDNNNNTYGFYYVNAMRISNAL